MLCHLKHNTSSFCVLSPIVHYHFSSSYVLHAMMDVPLLTVGQSMGLLPALQGMQVDAKFLSLFDSSAIWIFFWISLVLSLG